MVSNMRKCNLCRDDFCLDKHFIPININSSVTTRKEYILSQFLILIVQIYNGYNIDQINYIILTTNSVNWKNDSKLCYLSHNEEET